MIMVGLLVMLGLFHWLLTRKPAKQVSRNQQPEDRDMDNEPWVLGGED